MTTENKWLKWEYSKEKHFPRTLSTNVIVKQRDGRVSGVFPVSTFHGDGKPENSIWFDSGNSFDIVEYQVVEETEN